MFRTRILPSFSTRGHLRLIHASLRARKDFKLTDIGEGIVQVEVMKWFVKPGDKVKEFDKLLEVQSDKATVEITSRFAGTIKSLAMGEGQQAKVGEVLVVFEDDDSTKGVPNDIPSSPKMQTDTSSSIETKLPKQVINNNNAFQTGGGGGSLSDELEDPTMNNDKVLATPAVRHLAKENRINLTKIKGSGKDGRIMKEDILNIIGIKGATAQTILRDEPKLASAPAMISTTLPSQEAAAQPKPKGSVTVVPITGIRKEMVKTMTASLRIPHLGYMEDVNVDEALKVVAGRKDLTLLSVLIKAASMALVHYPELNAHANPEATELRVYEDHNIGIAMDTPRGLMVPVIQDVKSRSVLDIAKELKRLRELGASGKLGMADLANGTFSISNIGSIGGTYASPVIVPPQVAIGAFGRAKRIPVFESPQSMVVKEARIMPVSWSADHRVIDGALIARFCSQFKLYVENPADMLLRMH